MNFPALRDFTNARVTLGRVGHSLPMAEVLKLRVAHARAREAVHSVLDTGTLNEELGQLGRRAILLRSSARNRATYLQRPDLGKQLTEESSKYLESEAGQFDVAFVIVDGLSALAANRHAVPLLTEILHALPATEWSVGPIGIVEQGRVAIGDSIGERLRAALVLVLIGERPGLSCNDSLGVYLTWNPHCGMTDADRNCISNVHAQGLSYSAAAHKLLFLMNEARRRKLSGVLLKEEANSFLGSR